MRDANHRGFLDRRMSHQPILDIHGADPFSPGLHQVFGAVDNLDESFVVHRGDVAGLEPPILGPPMTLVRRLVIAGSHPRSPHFKFARRIAVAWSLYRLALESFRAH